MRSGHPGRLDSSDESSRLDKNRVQAVKRALRILSTFDHEKPYLGISELARQTGLNKAVVFRIVQTMVEDGFLERDAVNGTYRVGLRAFEVGSLYIPHATLERAAHGPMRDLATRHEYNVYLGSLEGRHVVYLAAVDGGGPIQVRAQVGSRQPAHATAIGKVLLAHLPPSVAAELLSSRPLERLTSATITDVDQLLDQLAAIREKGYATNEGESIEGVGSVAAGIRDRRDEVVAAVSNGFPLFQVGREGFTTLALDVVACAQAISEQMGWRAEETRHQG